MKEELLILGACLGFGSPGCAGGQSGGSTDTGAAAGCPIRFTPVSEVYQQFSGRYSSAYTLGATDNFRCDADVDGTITVEVSARTAASADPGEGLDAGQAPSAARNGDADAPTPQPFEPPCGAAWLPVTLEVALAPTPPEDAEQPASPTYSFPALLSEDGALHWDNEDLPEALSALQNETAELDPQQSNILIGGESLSTVRACCLEEPTQELPYTAVQRRGVAQWVLEACAAGKPEQLKLRFEAERVGEPNPCLANGQAGLERVIVHVFDPEGDPLVSLPGETTRHNSPRLTIRAWMNVDGLDGLGTSADDQVERIGVLIELSQNDENAEPNLYLDLVFGGSTTEPPCLLGLDEQPGR